jgi:hypothetical protein
LKLENITSSERTIPSRSGLLGRVISVKRSLTLEICRTERGTDFFMGTRSSDFIEGMLWSE